MHPTEAERAAVLAPNGGQLPELVIPELIGQVYEVAPPVERGRMLELLLQPLGVLSLVAVAHGIFANIRFRSGAREIHIQLEELRRVRPDDVVALAQHVQQVSVETVDSLAQLLAGSPQLAASAAAALLLATLVKRSRSRPSQRESPDELTPAR